MSGPDVFYVARWRGAIPGVASSLEGDGVPSREDRLHSSGSTGMDARVPVPDRVVFYWRPGCGFCVLLRRGLRRAGLEVTEINIFDDAEAAGVVRSVAAGNETVPTVMVGSRALVNPRAGDVVDLVRAEAPNLLPPDAGGADAWSPSRRGGPSLGFRLWNRR